MRKFFTIIGLLSFVLIFTGCSSAAGDYGSLKIDTGSMVAAAINASREAVEESSVLNVQVKVSLSGQGYAGAKKEDSLTVSMSDYESAGDNNPDFNYSQVLGIQPFTFNSVPVGSVVKADVEIILSGTEFSTVTITGESDSVLVKEGKNQITVELTLSAEGSGSDNPKPVDPTDPGEQTDPAEQKDPADPTDPAEQTDPTDPTDPTDVTDPTDPTDPNGKTDPTDPTETGSSTSGFEIVLPEFDLSSYITIVAAEKADNGTLVLSIEQKSSAPSDAAEVIPRLSSYLWFLDGQALPDETESVTLSLASYPTLTPSSIHYITLQVYYDEKFYTVTTKYTCQE